MAKVKISATRVIMAIFVLSLWCAYKMKKNRTRLGLSRTLNSADPIVLPSTLSRWEGEGGRLEDESV